MCKKPTLTSNVTKGDNLPLCGLLYQFNECLLSIYDVSGSWLGPGKSKENKTHAGPALIEFTV